MKIIKENLWKILMLFAITVMVGCSDVVSDDEGEQGDVVYNDSVLVAKERLIVTHAVKGQFKNKSLIETRIIGSDTVLISEIGDYSTGYTKVILDDHKLVGMAKEVGKSLIKTNVTGKSFNEFVNGTEFVDMTLDGYHIDDGSDTISIKMNVVSNLISAKMAGVETIESYNEAKRVVLADLRLDSSFNVNQACDDGTITDEHCGWLLAIGALLMRSAEWDFDPSNWDLIPYENPTDELQSFKYWIHDITHNIVREYTLIDGVEQIRKLTTEEKMDGYKELSRLCTNAQKSTGQLMSGSFRNLVKSYISDISVVACQDYMYDMYWDTVNDY